MTRKKNPNLDTRDAKDWDVCNSSSIINCFSGFSERNGELVGEGEEKIFPFLDVVKSNRKKVSA